MKKKKILTYCLMMCLAMGALNVYAVSPGEVFYDENDVRYEVLGASKAKVTGYEGTNPNVVIPSVVQVEAGKFRVTEIGTEAFKNNQIMESVVISKYVTTIPQDAFYGCAMLYKVVFEEGMKLEKIDDYAFYNCTGLIDIVIPTWYETVGGDTEEFPHFGSLGKSFYNVPNIIYNGKRTPERDKNYRWGAKNINGIVEGYLVYPADAEDKSELMLCSSAAKGAIVVPESVTYIRSKGFENCSRVTSVLIPAGVTKCGSSCFTGCSGLTSLICKATTPPAMNHYDWMPAFQDVNKSIPVYVPKAAMAAYKAAEGWSQFTNWQELTDETEEEITKYTITTSVNDPKMGSVTEGGTYDGGSDVTIEATANEGYVFVTWSDGVTETPRVVKLTQDTTIMAIFEEEVVEVTKYKLTVTVNDPKMGSVTGGGEYEENATAVLNAVAAEGYRFVSWSDGKTGNPRSIVMTADVTLKATFEKIPEEVKTFTVTTEVNDAEMGEVIGGGVFSENTEVTLLPQPKDGFQFVQWTDGVTDNPRKFILTQDTTFTAVFEAIPVTMFTVIAVVNDPAMGSVSGAGEYEENATVTLTATANEGYEFSKWSDNDTANPKVFTITEDVALIAIFAEKAGQGIEEVEKSKIESRKILREGVLYIEANGKTYDAVGR